MPYDSVNYNMSVNPKFIPEKFKKSNILDVNQIELPIQEEVKNTPIQKNSNLSSSDILEQQRQIKKTDLSSQILNSSKKRSTDLLNLNDILNSTVNFILKN